MSFKVLKDSIDGKLDVSSLLIDYNGFIPVPQIITEPALGNIGLLLTPVFIKPNKYKTEGENIPPDITAGFIGYTANKSWGIGGMRIASLPKLHLKYRVAAAYGNANLDFYRTLPQVGEEAFSFNFKSTVLYGSILRQIGKTELYMGLEYMYLNNNIDPNFNFENRPDDILEKDLKSQLGSLGLQAEFDKRNSIFTPDTGWLANIEYLVNSSWTGSDYEFQNLNIFLTKYFQFTPKWVSGFRYQSTFQFGDAPFYSKPSIQARGVPMARYQGDETYMLETEQRYDITPRWSAIGFVGASKAPSEQISFKNAETIYNYGTGFRYLIARKFKLRTGVDLAWSNHDFGWYIVFGSAWNIRS
ncbi:BamA/TamA family outer membrane protein [Pseudotamlana agarivorans]|uniref:BamA/TamA family outer membrane protein n=1 Tax=Pseudotamlana agarivorans TaxID=481183 RepID=UPI001FDF6601|nr:BamA/TamA family outer membrane protein [Tamlana agarivorans]